MKAALIVFLFTICSLITYSQENETVLDAPDDWLSEIIPFPLGFAREIDFEGFEDLRFAANWSDSTSQEFWTYMFVWYIEKDSGMTESKLRENFNLYYDGLMDVNSNGESKTASLFVKTADGFNGEMKVYDRFFTKHDITLNIKVRESFCPQTNKQIIQCEISPKAFDNPVWKKFEAIKLKVKCE